MNNELPEVDPYTIGFNEGYKVGFQAGLEAAKQCIVRVIEEEKNNIEKSSN